MKDTERHDIEAAALNARTFPRPPGSPPHHLRCDWVRGCWDDATPKVRCKLADGHTGEHEYE